MGVSGHADTVLSPIRGRMKVLKKFKKRMGLAPRTGGSGTNNLPPLQFHQVHGDNIRVSRDGTVARRAESFCKGVTFSSRPVKISEKVCVKFLEVSNNWSGVIRFGFTCNDPNNLRYALPKYACPDLTNKPGYWAKALAERFAERDTVLFYYVTPAGDVHFGINGEEKGIFFSGVETRGPLWAIIDVYGNSTAIELVDPRQQLNNSRRNLSPQQSAATDSSPDAIERLILPSLTSLSIHQPRLEDTPQPQPPPLPPQESGAVVPVTSSYQHQQQQQQQQHSQPSHPYLSPLPFHRTRGRNIRLSNDRCIATRSDAEFSLGYVFTSRPVHLGEKIVIQVLATQSLYVGSLAFGLTSCDPATLQPADLPDDSDLLLDRPEYWVVSKYVVNSPQRGEELSFCITHSGEVQVSRNGGPPAVVMHVDQTLQLWAFWDVYGNTQKIRILGSQMEQPAPPPPHLHHPRSLPGSRNSSPPPRTAEALAPGRLRVNLPAMNGAVLDHADRQIRSPEGAAAPVQPPPSVPVPVAVPVTTAQAELVQYQSAAGPGCGTVLVVKLPPAHSNYLNQQNQQNRHNHSVSPGEPSSSGTLLSTYSHTYIEPVSATSYSTIDSTTTLQQWAEATGTSGGGTGTECTICYERPIDSVLYMCGHMCMCYECAVQQWRGKGGGHCPLCRAVIRDVIRTYKS
ncbi:protein neuralized isoform X2 [Schistocerca gregaria]|uniref:protein neuralized isoform X2 n=1 Tax=Schistocerca gregaria TaxID=7010 RepID=UPI00211E7DCE|nr:protein neuralized isoform X2 [Schistocerca gregaria]